MKKIFDWKEKINEEELKEVVSAIKNNDIVLVPTETVYGIAANAYSDETCKKIYEAKGRASDNPLIIHVSDESMISKIAEKPNEIEEKLIKAFMPGPFTLILNKKKNDNDSYAQNKTEAKENKEICNVASAGMNTIGIRMPSHKIMHEIIKQSDTPIAAPSANVSGRPSGTCIQDIIEELEEKIDFAIDGGKSKIGIESTVVRVIDGVPTILRPGYVTEKMIKEAVGNVALSDKLFRAVNKDEKVESPGMKYRHYAPRTKCVLIESSDIQVQKVNELIKKLQNNENSKINISDKDNSKGICIVGFEEDKESIDIDKDKFISLGSKYNLEEISQNIFTALRKVDKMNCKIAIIEGVEKKELGLSIMNRLIRACENDTI